MDAAINPPVRLQALSSTSISTKSALARVDEFLVDLENRGTPAKGADTTIVAQLKKMSLALRQERARKGKTMEIARHAHCRSESQSYSI